MDYLKAKGETHLRPAMRRLILWGMASPFLAFAVGYALVAAFRFDGQAYVLFAPFGCYSFVSSAVIVAWGVRIHRQIKIEPRTFVNTFRIILSLNALYLAFNSYFLFYAIMFLRSD